MEFFRDSEAFFRIFTGAPPSSATELPHAPGEFRVSLPLGEPLGMRLSLTNEVLELKEGLAAHRAGIARGDLVAEVDGWDVSGVDAARHALKHQPDEGQETREIVLIRGEPPSDLEPHAPWDRSAPVMNMRHVSPEAERPGRAAKCSSGARGSRSRSAPRSGHRSAPRTEVEVPPDAIRFSASRQDTHRQQQTTPRQNLESQNEGASRSCRHERSPRQEEAARRDARQADNAVRAASPAGPQCGAAGGGLQQAQDLAAVSDVSGTPNAQCSASHLPGGMSSHAAARAYSHAQSFAQEAHNERWAAQASADAPQPAAASLTAKPKRAPPEGPWGLALQALPAVVPTNPPVIPRLALHGQLATEDGVGPPPRHLPPRPPLSVRSPAAVAPAAKQSAAQSMQAPSQAPSQASSQTSSHAPSPRSAYPHQPGVHAGASLSGKGASQARSYPSDRHGDRHGDCHAPERPQTAAVAQQQSPCSYPCSYPCAYQTSAASDQAVDQRAEPAGRVVVEQPAGRVVVRPRPQLIHFHFGRDARSSLGFGVSRPNGRAVNALKPGGTAEAAGLRVGDVLVQVNGVAVQLLHPDVSIASLLGRDVVRCDLVVERAAADCMHACGGETCMQSDRGLSRAGYSSGYPAAPGGSTPWSCGGHGSQGSQGSQASPRPSNGHPRPPAAPESDILKAVLGLPTGGQLPGGDYRNALQHPSMLQSEGLASTAGQAALMGPPKRPPIGPLRAGAAPGGATATPPDQPHDEPHDERSCDGVSPFELAQLKARLRVMETAEEALRSQNSELHVRLSDGEKRESEAERRAEELRAEMARREAALTEQQDQREADLLSRCAQLQKAHGELWSQNEALRTKADVLCALLGAVNR